MKTRFWRFGWLALCVAALPLVSGCEEQSAADIANVSSPETNLTAATLASVPTDSEVAEVEENAPPPEQAEPAPGSTNKPVPADLKLSPKTSEVVKLSQAGVNESVMLAFVTNSTGTFNLGSEQIVYLNDLGVSSDVLTAMLEHDRMLREGNVAMTAVAPPQAAAPAAPAEVVAPPASAEPPAAAVAESVPPPPANVTYNYFCNSLSPYGTWVEVDGYGSCWQPSVVVLNSGWRPYCDGGRWIYTDHGWYWQSDYSWGWAPFHYGRWFCHPRWGWCWRPDYAWGPAWVSWRYTDEYCGWAPLPPAACYTPGLGFTYYGSSVGFGFGFGLGWSSYAFVPWRHFHDHRPYRYCVPHHEVRTIYGHSTVVNNIAIGHNNTIIHHGIGVGRVRDYTHREVRPVQVREVALTDRDHRAPGDRLERGGRELVIHRPRLPDNVPAPAPPPRMSAPFAPAVGNVAAPPSSRMTSRDRDRSLSEDPRRPERRETAGGSAPALPPRMSAPGAPAPPASRPRTDVVNAPPGERTIVPGVGAPSGRTTRPSDGERTKDRPAPRQGVTLATPQPQAPSVPSKLETTPPKREVYPPGSLVWNGRRETAPSTTPSAPSTASPPASRTTDSRPRGNMTTVWPRRAETDSRVVVRQPPQAPPTPSSPAPVTPRVIEVPQSRAYTAPAPAAPRVVYPDTPRSYSPPPTVKSEQRPSSPVINLPARPSYSPPPVSRSEPSFAPRPAPSPPSFSPPPSYSPPPRSAPSPPPSSSGGSGRSDQGGDNRRPR